MKKLFKWLLLVIAILTLGVVVLVYNPGIYKGSLERYLSDVAGYPISLKGDLEIDLGRHTVVSAKDIQISGPAWARRQDLITIAHLEIAVLTSSIFKDIVVLESLQVDSLDFNLEVDADGKGNWITAAKPSEPSDKNDNETVIIYKDVTIEDTNIRYFNGETQIDHLFNIASLQHHHQADDLLHTTLKGSFNDRAIDYTGSIGPYLNLLDGHDVRFTMNGRFGELEIEGDGLIDDLLAPRRPTLNLNMQGPDIDEITSMLGADDLGEGGFSLRVKGEAVLDHYEAEINGKVGDVSLNASALLSDLAQLEELDLTMAANGPSLGAFTRFFRIEDWPDKPFSLKGDVKRVGGTLNISELALNIGGTQLKLDALLTNFPSLDASRIKLDIDGDDIVQFRELIGIPGIATGPFDLTANLDVTTEDIELIQVDLKTSLGQASVSGTLGDGPKYIGSKFQLHLDGDNAHALVSALGIDAIPEQPFNMNASIEIVDNGLQLENTQLEYEGIKLGIDGKLNFADQLLGSGLDFKLQGSNLSSLGNFNVIGDSLDIFVPGQAYQASGQLTFVNNGWQLNTVSGNIGQTELDFDGLVSNQTGLRGSNLRFSIKGPSLNQLLLEQDKLTLPPGSYQSSGHLALTKDRLKIDDFNFENDQAHAELALDLGWPVSERIDAGFNVSLWGDDIRYLLPKFDMFEADIAAFKLNAVGQKQAGQISLKTFKADIGNLQILMIGEIGDEPDSENADVTFSIVSDDLSRLGKLNGDYLPAMGLDFKTDFKGNASQFVLSNLIVSLGESQLEGNLDVALNRPKPQYKFTARSNYIDIRPYLDSDDSVDAEDETADTKDQQFMIPAIPLPLEALAVADISVSLHISELQHHKDSIKNLIFETELKAGSLNISEYSFEGPKGTFKTSLSIQPTGANQANVNIDLSADNLALNLSGLPKEKLHDIPAMSLDFHASGRGSDTRQVAGSLNGEFYLETSGGTLAGVDLSILDTFILDEIFGLLMPKSDAEKDLTLKCAATILKIENGLIKTDPAFAFTTDKIEVITKGTLDLKTEKMNFNFNATPTNALKISAGELFNPYILIGGTLSKPQVGIDPTKVLLHGGAAIGTAGISILAKGFIDRVSNAMPICEEMQKKVKQIK